MSKTAPPPARREQTYTSHSRQCTCTIRFTSQRIHAHGTKVYNAQVQSLVHGLHGGGEQARRDDDARPTRRHKQSTARRVRARHTCARPPDSDSCTSSELEARVRPPCQSSRPSSFSPSRPSSTPQKSGSSTSEVRCVPCAPNGLLEVRLTGYTIPAIENLGITKVRVPSASPREQTFMRVAVAVMPVGPT